MVIAVGACLLMIAGEFDLSVGSMIGFAGMMIAIFSVTLGWPVWLAILVTFALVHRDRRGERLHRHSHRPAELYRHACVLSSYFRGFTIFLPQLIERKTIIGGIQDDAAEGDWLAPLFGSKILHRSVYQWMGDMGVIGTFAQGSQALGSRWWTVFQCSSSGRLRSSCVRPCAADPHKIRQLDICNAGGDAQAARYVRRSGESG